MTNFCRNILAEQARDAEMRLAQIPTTSLGPAARTLRAGNPFVHLDFLLSPDFRQRSIAEEATHLGITWDGKYFYFAHEAAEKYVESLSVDAWNELARAMESERSDR